MIDDLFRKITDLTSYVCDFHTVQLKVMPFLMCTVSFFGEGICVLLNFKLCVDLECIFFISGHRIGLFHLNSRCPLQKIWEVVFSKGIVSFK